MALAGVVFDKDGTLFDFDATWAPVMARTISELGRDAAHRGELARALGFDLAAERFQPDSLVIAGTSGEVAAALERQLPGETAESIRAGMDRVAAAAPQVPVLPLEPFLHGLAARGLALGVVTNDSEAPARAHLAGQGAEALFHRIIGSDSGFGAKPGPGPLLEMCRGFGLAPDQVVMVGDSTTDLRSGRAAGCITVGVLTGPADRSDLSGLADAVLDSIADLPAWLDRQPG